MTDNPQAHCSIRDSSSSDEECLSAIKNKVNLHKNKYSTDYDEDSDEDSIVPAVLVKVEVTEVNENDCALDYSMNNGEIPTTKSKRKLRKPQKISKPKKKRTYDCGQCDANFEYVAELRKHSLTHQVETRHFCERCGRYFKKAFSLRLHMRVHDITQEKCPLCDLTFSMRLHLGRHLMTHERTEWCDKCPARFHTKEQLEQHHNSSHNENNKKSHTDRSQTVKNQYQSAESSDKQMDNSDDTEPGTSTVFDCVKNELDSDDYEDHNTKNKKLNNTQAQNNYPPNYLKMEDMNSSTKTAIVTKMHKGKSVPDLCRLYNTTPDVINSIWEEREKYTLAGKHGKRTNRYMNNLLDSKLVAWFNEQRANDVQVSGKMLQDIAEAFAKDCGFVAFNGSKKWLDRFKKRYNILLRSTPRNRDYHNPAIESKWKKQFFKEQWSDASLGFCSEDIFTADEVGFYYNPSKGRIKKLAGRKYIQGHIQDRLAIFMCANVSGNIKKKLLVCGSEDPLLHSHRNPDTLPVTYIRHSQAHFTTQIFEEYVKYWNRELQIANKRAILILDRATIHSKLQLSNLKLVFVPWKASTGLMPIKNGIHTKFREEFRRLVLLEKSMNVVRGVDRNMTCLEALNMVCKAWERVPSESITKGFEVTGYDIQDVVHERKWLPQPKVSDKDEEVMCKMLEDFDVEPYFTDLTSLDMYLTVDDEYLTGQGTNGSVFGGNHRVTDPPTKYSQNDEESILPLATDKPESEETEDVVKRNRALQDLEIVRKYLLGNNTSYETYCSFMEVEKFLMQLPVNYESNICEK